MEEINLMLLASRWIHISAAIVAVGGAVFMRLALLPSAKEVLDDDLHQRLREAVRARWARLVHTCVALLLLSGAFNFVVLVLSPKIEPMPYHAIFAVKFLAALGVFFLGIVLSGRSAVAEKMRRNSAKWLSVMIAAAALVVLMSGLLGQVRGRSATNVPTVTISPES